MAEVLKIARNTKQPYGGYINPKQFSRITFNDHVTLNADENISGELIGKVVHYMTRILLGIPKEDVFEKSLFVGKIAMKIWETEKQLLDINGLDDQSIISACKLTYMDGFYSNPYAEFINTDAINPDRQTIDNIVTMIHRSLMFFDIYGPVVETEVPVYDGKKFISSNLYGYIDYLTQDTIWDFKVLRRKISSVYTLQLLMYYILGKNSADKKFSSITKIGFFNPRFNTVYTLKTADIPDDVIETVSRDVMDLYLTPQERLIKEHESSTFIKDKDARRKFYASTMTDMKTYYEDAIPQGIPCSMSVDYFLLAALREKEETNYKFIYEKEPVYWSGNYIPDDVTDENLWFIVRIDTRFEVKEGKKSFIILPDSTQLHFYNNSFYDYRYQIICAHLNTSDIYDEEHDKYIKTYVDKNGKRKQATVTLILTSDDFKLFQETYDISYLKIIEGYYFK